MQLQILLISFQTDLYGQNILHITHPEDHKMLKEKLVPSDLDNLFDIQPEDKTNEPRQRTQAEEDEIDRRLREDKRSFTIRSDTKVALNTRYNNISVYL